MTRIDNRYDKKTSRSRDNEGREALHNSSYSSRYRKYKSPDSNNRDGQEVCFDNSSKRQQFSRKSANTIERRQKKNRSYTYKRNSRNKKDRELEYDTLREEHFKLQKKRKQAKLKLPSYVSYVESITADFKTLRTDEYKYESILKFIGLAKRAGSLVQGAGILGDNLAGHKLFLVIIASDASDNAKRLFREKIKNDKVAAVYFSTKSELGAILGRDEAVYIGIKDRNFATGLWKKIETDLQ